MFLTLFFTLCQIDAHFRKPISEEEALMKDIREATNSIRKSSMEQMACLRTWSVKNQLELDKFRAEVQQELQNESKGSTVKPEPNVKGS